jgi:hypothetical protein
MFISFLGILLAHIRATRVWLGLGVSGQNDAVGSPDRREPAIRPFDYYARKSASPDMREAYRTVSSRQLKGVLALNGLPDQATRALNESEFVREAALQQDADPKVPGHISHCYQRYILRDAQVHQLVGLYQYEKGLSRWSLDLCELAPKILEINVVKTSAECNWLLADEFEASIQRTEDLVLQKDARFQSFLDTGVLHNPAQFLVDLRHMFSSLSNVA